MDKLLDISDSENVNDNTKIYRFQCDCTEPCDAMDVLVDAAGTEGEDKYFIICMSFGCTGFIDRLKYAAKILYGKWRWREFCVRQEDIPNLSEIFDPNRKFSELP